MKTTKTTWTLKAMLLGATLGLVSGDAWADPDSSNDSDSLTISVTPNVDLGVNVDTGTAKWEGSADLTMTLATNATAYLASPATVTVLGTFNNQEVQVQGAALDTWALDRKSTRLNSSHSAKSRMPSSA